MAYDKDQPFFIKKFYAAFVVQWIVFTIVVMGTVKII